MSSLTQFIEVDYSRFFSDSKEIVHLLEKETDLKRMLEIVYNVVKKADKKIYLIIDEYDHFANDIIAMGDSEYYQKIIQASGFVRDFYETLKIGTKSVIDKIFITGISPIMLDDLTSGFNITMNITMEPLTNEMLGFTDEEIDQIINRVKIDLEQISQIKVQLKEYYNGYLFNEECKKRVYNPDMVLYYFDQLLRYNKLPRELITDNVKTDYGRLDRLTRNQENRKTLEKIILNEGIITKIVSKFSFDRIFEQEYFISLLFYMGLLTINGTKYGLLQLGIPNYVIKTIYWEYIEKKLREDYKINYDLVELQKVVWQMAYDGKLEPFLKFITENVLNILSNRDMIKFNEKYLKVILFSYLVLSNLYKPTSEKEVEGGYIDIFLEKDIRFSDVKYEWLWELKYLKKNDTEQLEQVKEEGLRQLKKYAESKKFKNKGNLKLALIIFIGKDEYVLVMP